LALTVAALVAVLLSPTTSLASPAFGGKGPDEGGQTARVVPKAAAAIAAAPAGAESLYIGDEHTMAVNRVDAVTGAYQGAFIPTDPNSPDGYGVGGIDGPRGLLFFEGKLFLNNQNEYQPPNDNYPGEVLEYAGNTGQFLGALVPCQPVAPYNRPCSADAPFNPRQLVAGPGHTLFVADLGDFGADTPPFPGRIAQFDSMTGQFLGNLDATGFTAPGGFNPRGLVWGPDGMLYVSVVGNLQGTDTTPPDRISGYIVRFNPITSKYANVFTSNAGAGCAADLHRPEGLVFGPDGKLYVTSFRANASDTDKILVFDGRRGTCLKEIALYTVGQDRAYAQDIIFGPKGDLFVPILTTGEIRRYNVQTGAYTTFVASSANGGPLTAPWSLIFRDSDPRTLSYKGPG
jgi:hypothetical protein